MGKEVLIGAGIIAVLLVSFVAVAIFINTKGAGVGGFTSLSISNVEIVEGGKFIRVYGVSNGAEQLSISLNPSQLNQYIQDDGYEATKSLTGSIILDKQLKRFPIIKQIDKNYYELKTMNVGGFSSCPSQTGFESKGKVPDSTLGTDVCLYVRGIGTNSEFSGQSIRDSQVSFNIGGSTGILNPSSGTNVLTLNDGQTKVEWVGDLSNYNQISAPSYSVLFHESKYQKLITKDAFSRSESETQTFQDCIARQRITGSSAFDLAVNFFFTSKKSVSEITSCTNNYNNKITTLLVDKTSEYSSSINDDGIIFTENAMQIDLKTADAFPTFIITLDASKVGIIELKGKPDIVSCVETRTINSGDTISVDLQVKNIGSNSGSFYGSVSCSGQATASGTISEQLVEKGETISIPLQITGSNTIEGTESASCIYTIIDRKSQDKDSCTSILNVKYQSGLICEPNKKKCLDEKTLQICSADGKSEDLEECELGCSTLADGTGVCKVAEDSDDDGLQCSFGQIEKPAGKFLFYEYEARCGTASWVFFTIFLVFITLIVFAIVLLRKVF